MKRYVSTKNTQKRAKSVPKAEVISASVVDIFCGVGGLSHGFKLEGFPISCGIDIDESCRYAFEVNNGGVFHCQDVAQIKPEDVNRVFHTKSIRVLIGCAPCQPFSIYNQNNNDPQWRLLDNFGKLIDQIRPEIVSMENVPSLVNFRRGRLFKNFVKTLENAGYHVWWSSIFCPDYGVPQNRTRLVLLASQLGPLRLHDPTHSSENYVTVHMAIGNLPKLKAGEGDSKDALHRASALSPLNFKRIKVACQGGTWRDWSPELVAKCHRRSSGKTYPAVYGRMSWDEPSPTITTQYYGFGNGRFGHPEQNRAISLREGAILQSFPKNYRFLEPGSRVHFKRLGRLIGNAVPVLLARAIAKTVKSHLVNFS